MSPPRFSAAHAEDLRPERDRAKPQPSLAKEVARFHDMGRRLKDVPIAGRYRPLMAIHGGMSVLYLAKDIIYGKKVVVKMARTTPNGISPEISAKAIRREARVLSRIRHDNVVRILAKGFFVGSEFIVLEHVEGSDLHDVLNKKGQLPWPMIRGIMLQLCDALQETHDAGIAHSDIKPENIFISADGSMKVTLLDFGLARFIYNGLSEPRPEGLLGTLDYMAPEDLHLRVCDHRVDIYGLGIVMYELLTGWNPFFADDTNEVASRILTAIPRPPGFWADSSPGVDDLVMRAIAKAPKDRFGSMAEMKDAILRCP